MNTAKTWGPFNFLWKWFNNLPIAIYVMLLLAALNALGTVLPQEHLVGGMSELPIDQQYIQKFGEQRWEIIRLLGLHHIYFTPVFFIALSWLCISATICNITRYKRTMREWKTPAVNRGPGFFTSNKRSLSIAKPASGSAAQIIALLKEKGFRVVEAEQDGGVQSIYADRGFIQRWGMMVLHVAVLVLLFGGIYGSIFGNKGNVRMGDGETKTLTLNLAEGKHPLVRWFLEKAPERSYLLKQDKFRIDYGRKLVLPTVLQNEKEFSAVYQEYAHFFVKDFVSNLTVERNSVSKTQEVLVNHPLVIDKLMLFQSGYEQNGYISYDIDGQTTEQLVPSDMWLCLTPNGIAKAENLGNTDKVFLLEKVKAGDLYIDGENTGYLGPMTIAHVQNVMIDAPPEQIMLDTQQGFSLSLNGKPVEIRMSPQIQNFSIFSYKRDPGMPVLYLGWILMIIGIGVALYVPFNKVHIRIEQEQGMFLISGVRGGGLKGLRREIHAILSA
jgi:cytochrome c biogenesis protein